MNRKLLPFSVMMLIFASCSNDFEESAVLSLSSNETEQYCAVVDYEDIFVKEANSAKTKSRIVRDDIVEDELVVVYGSDRTQSVKNAKIALNGTSAAKFGLPSGIYVVEYLLCYKNVSKPGYDFWSEESNKCGYKPSQDFVLGNSSISVTKERGYEEPGSNSTELKTFVLHVISDMAGRRLDRYDPCTPQDIEWRYSISKQL